MQELDDRFFKTLAFGTGGSFTACQAPLDIEETASESTLVTGLDWAGFPIGPGDVNDAVPRADPILAVGNRSPYTVNALLQEPDTRMSGFCCLHFSSVVTVIVVCAIDRG